MSEVESYTLLSTGTTAANNNIIWVLKVSTVINEDTGDVMLRWYHDLTANILKTDKILFEVSFYAGTDAQAATRQSADIGAMAEDGGQCALQINSDDTQFWSATLSDIYYICNNTEYNASNDGPLVRCVGNNSAGAANTNDYTSDTVNVEAADENDWVLPYEDNNSEAKWCTEAGSKTTWSPF